MNCFWANHIDQVSDAVDFVAEHIDPSYISHGEVQSGRAEDLKTWSPNLKQVLMNEFGDVCYKQEGYNHSYLAIGTKDEKIMCVAFLTVFRSGYSCFAVLEDIVTSPDQRKLGYGKKLYEWAEAELKRKNVGRIFLESGMANSDVHPFLKK